MRSFFMTVGALALVVSGCGGGNASSHAVTSGASSPGSSSSAVQDCTVKGYYPKTRKVLSRVRPVVLYGQRIGLAPGTGQRGSGGLERDEPLPRLGVRVSAPDGAVLTPVLRRSVATTIAGASVRALPDSVPGHWRLPVRNHDRQFLVYSGAKLYQGTWSARICGAGMNDGSKVVRYSGTFSVLGHLHHGVARCHEAPTGSALHRRAIERACM